MGELDGNQTQRSEKTENDKDEVLAFIVSLANKGAISLGITLCVGGTMVTGQLIGGKEFFEGIANSYGNVSDFFRGLGEGGAEGYKDTSQEQLDNVENIAFIHLGNARVVSSGISIPSFEQPGIFWRGRLSSVDGFFFGQMGKV